MHFSCSTIPQTTMLCLLMNSMSRFCHSKKWFQRCRFLTNKKSIGKGKEKLNQKMKNDNGTPLGLKAILQERGLWDSTLWFKVCENFSARDQIFKRNKNRANRWSVSIRVSSLTGILNSTANSISSKCFGLLVKSWTWRHCTYYFKELNVIVPASLEHVSLQNIRQFVRKCYRYMDANRLKDGHGSALTPQQI